MIDPRRRDYDHDRLASLSRHCCATTRARRSSEPPPQGRRARFRLMAASRIVPASARAVIQRERHRQPARRRAGVSIRSISPLRTRWRCDWQLVTFHLLERNSRQASRQGGRESQCRTRPAAARKSSNRSKCTQRSPRFAARQLAGTSAPGQSADTPGGGCSALPRPMRHAPRGWATGDERTSMMKRERAESSCIIVASVLRAVR